MLNISLPETIEARLSTEAQRRGMNVEQYATQLLERLLTTPTVDEVLAPFRKQVADSALSDDQLDALFENARDEVWKEQQGQHS